MEAVLGESFVLTVLKALGTRGPGHGDALNSETKSALQLFPRFTQPLSPLQTCGLRPSLWSLAPAALSPCTFYYSQSPYPIAQAQGGACLCLCQGLVGLAGITTCCREGVGIGVCSQDRAWGLVFAQYVSLTEGDITGWDLFARPFPVSVTFPFSASQRTKL